MALRWNSRPPTEDEFEKLKQARDQQHRAVAPGADVRELRVIASKLTKIHWWLLFFIRVTVIVIVIECVRAFVMAH